MFWDVSRKLEKNKGKKVMHALSLIIGYITIYTAYVFYPQISSAPEYDKLIEFEGALEAVNVGGRKTTTTISIRTEDGLLSFPNWYNKNSPPYTDSQAQALKDTCLGKPVSGKWSTGKALFFGSYNEIWELRQCDAVFNRYYKKLKNDRNDFIRFYKTIVYGCLLFFFCCIGLNLGNYKKATLLLRLKNKNKVS
jgi:hypothetical protein